MTQYYKVFSDVIKQSLDNLIVTHKSEEIDQETGFDQWVEATRVLTSNKATLYLVGNGASAAMSAHMSADAFKNGDINARCLNEPSLMTAIGNDIEYEQVFAYPITKFATSNDALITISSSGNSPNIIAAIEAAKSNNMKVITLSGMKEDNKSRSMGDLNFYIPAKSYGIVECSHQILLHCWLDKYMDLTAE